MPAELIASLRRLPDVELVARLKDLAARERDITAELVAHLAELETRSLHLQAGYGSLFVYCRDALRLSEHESYNRIEVARAARRYPVIFERLASGEVNLTTIRLLAPYLTPENHLQVLEEARGKKKTAVEEMVARLAPWPDEPVVIRKLPSPRIVSVAVPPSSVPQGSVPQGSATQGSATQPPVPFAQRDPAPPGSAARPEHTVATDGPALPPQAVSPMSPPRPATVVPLSPDRYKLQVTIAGATLEKLRLAKDMLRHALPSGDEAILLDRALTSLLADLARKKFAATDRPRPGRESSPGSRRIPAEVRRAVWLRDLGRCAYVASDGRRCGERAFLEFHHRRPYAVGGEATTENIPLRCRRHNDYEGKVFFGDLVEADLASAAGGTAASAASDAGGATGRPAGNSFQNELVPPHT